MQGRMAPMPTPDDRITELEIALTHQEATVEELSAVLREQAARIDLLERRIARLAERQDAAEAGTAPDADVPPPHW